jgi:PKD domain
MKKLGPALLAFTGLLVAGTAVAGVLLRAPADAATPSTGVLFGAAAYDPSGFDITGVESQTGRTLAIERAYSQWDDAQPTTKVRNDVRIGRTPLVSIRPQRADGTKIAWASIAAGEHDAEITAQARGLASVGAPVMLAFHHEADYASGYGIPADFRAAFRHYVEVVRATGETNISFVLILGAGDYGSHIADWYPGDDVVDWAGADAYNFGACHPGALAWRSLDTATAPFRSWGQAHQKPLVLAEWGSAEDPSSPGRKAQWITDAGTLMKSWPQLRAASYFDETGSCDWRLTTSASALGAFRDLARSVTANPGPTARLTASASARTVRWSSTGSTGSHHVTGHGVTTWSFSPGDGRPGSSGTGSPPSFTHAYTAAGSFTASLTVADATGQVSTTHATVTLG